MNDMEWGGGMASEGPFVPKTGAGAAMADGVTAAQAIAVAEGLFWSYVKDLKLHEAALEQRPPGRVDPGELKKAVSAARDVREAIQLLMWERNKVDKLRKDIAGGVGGGALDLDAARDEVGRRLACLRRAGGG